MAYDTTIISSTSGTRRQKHVDALSASADILARLYFEAPGCLAWLLLGFAKLGSIHEFVAEQRADNVVHCDELCHSTRLDEHHARKAMMCLTWLLIGFAKLVSLLELLRNNWLTEAHVNCAPS